MSNNQLEKYQHGSLLYISASSNFEGRQRNSCLFGISAYNNDLPSITAIPDDIDGFYAYFGEGNLELLEQLIAQKINEKLEYLALGFVHDNKAFGYKDYSKITNLLSKTSFPNLKTFEYGVDYLLANEEIITPYLGDLTTVLENMPKLEHIDILGSFNLQKPLDLRNVKYLYVSDYSFDEMNVDVSKETIINLTQSPFFNLEDFEIALSSEETIYSFDKKMFINQLPNLKKVAIEGLFEIGTKEKLQELLPHLGEKLNIQHITENLNSEDEGINKILYEVPDNIDYTEFPDELDFEDITSDMIEKVRELMLHNDFNIQFRATWLLTSWADDEAYQKLISILYRDDLMNNDGFMPHRLHSFNEAYPQIVRAIISYRAHQKDNGNKNVVKTIREPLSFIIKKSNELNFPIDQLYYLRDENEACYYVPFVKEHLKKIITDKEFNYWRIHDGLKFILRFDKSWVDELLNKHRLNYKYFKLEEFDTQRNSFWKSIFGK